MSTARLAGVLCGALVLVAGCGSSDDPVRRYFAGNNAAARQGPAAQQEFLDRTQHPDFVDQVCELGDTTIELDPAMSTLRPDPGFTPDGAGPVRGEVWAVGVEVTLRRQGTVVGRQIGSQHVVLIDDQPFGFAPCPT